MSKNLLRNTIFIGIFLVPFVPFLVSSSLFFPYITTKAFAWRTIVEVIFAAWALLALSDAEYRPRKSPILYGIGAFLLVISLADLFGAAPWKSFWSNFERMEGFVTLLHLGAYFLVIGSVFKELDWKRWWNTSLAASFLMVIYCLFQLAGVITIQQGGVRVDGTFGNAIYLAVYMLFHIFVALYYMLRQWKDVSVRWLYGLLIFFQALILYFTATRGAILALIGGFLVFALLNMRNREEKGLRRFSISVIVALIVLVGGFFLARDTSFVRESPVLARFASLNLEELKSQGRYFIWPMAWEGFKDRPLLGWGQENFSYVFQEHYRPEMYRLEPWFDRAHNIFLDWMVAGGALGILTYLSLYVFALYLIWRTGSFSTTERSVLTALIAAYFFHNFFVFDHLISYVLFFSLLAYIYSRSGGEPLWNKTVSEKQSKTIALPLTVILLLGVFYLVNWQPLKGNTSLIQALQAVQTSGFANIRASLEKAYGASRLGRTEVSEQTAAQTPYVISSNISMEEKNAYYAFARKAVLEERGETKDDARHHLVAGTLLSSVGSIDEALTHLEKARELMPQKQMILFEIGAAYINKNDMQRAFETFKEAYEMAPGYEEAQIIYLIGAIYANNRTVEAEMLAILPERTAVFDDRIAAAYFNNGRIDRVRALVNERKRLDPANAATYDQYLLQLQSQN